MTLPDAQSRAFRDAGDHERVSDWQLADHVETLHRPATSLAGIRLPEQHEADLWDAGRERPKTHQEAERALAVRIADPTAPDGEEVLGAYDRWGR